MINFFRHNLNKKDKISIFRYSNSFTRSLSKGFTLVEMMVSISIFTLAVLSSIIALSKGISDTGYAKKKIIASYLAQEGVEYIRNLRDTYMLYYGTTQSGWNQFNIKTVGSLYPSGTTICGTANGCYFDDRNVNYADISLPITDLVIVTCTSATCANGPMLYDSTTGKYGYVSGTNSGYFRKIKITQISANEVKVFSTVHWTHGTTPYSVTFSENLFNWIE